MGILKHLSSQEKTNSMNIDIGNRKALFRITIIARSQAEKSQESAWSWLLISSLRKFVLFLPTGCIISYMTQLSESESTFIPCLYQSIKLEQQH